MVDKTRKILTNLGKTFAIDRVVELTHAGRIGGSRDWNGMVFHLPMEPWQYPERQLSGFSPRDVSETCEAIAKTLWTLWQWKTDLIWGLVREWALASGALGEAAQHIIASGISGGQLAAADAFAELERWLAKDSRSGAAAARLVGAIVLSSPPGLVQTTVSRWGDHNVPALELLPDVLSHLIENYPREAVELMDALARTANSGRRAIVIKALAALPVPPDKDQQYYIGLETALLWFLSRVHSNRAIASAIRGVLGRIRGRRGRSAEKSRRTRDRGHRRKHKPM